jgi:hypothetical protein
MINERSMKNNKLQIDQVQQQQKYQNDIEHFYQFSMIWLVVLVLFTVS